MIINNLIASEKFSTKNLFSKLLSRARSTKKIDEIRKNFVINQKFFNSKPQMKNYYFHKTDFN
jgi:hypothetical protein